MPKLQGRNRSLCVIYHSPRYFRQKLRDHDPPARWASLQLSADVRQTPPEPGRRFGQPTAPGLRFVDGVALCLRQSPHLAETEYRNESGRNSHVAVGFWNFE